MDLTLLAILYTALFAIGFQTVRNAGRAGPAGRTEGLPTFQRRVLVATVVMLLCVVVNLYLMSRRLTTTRPDLLGALLLDVAALLAMLGALSAVRRSACPASVRRTGLCLAGYATALSLGAGALAFAWITPDGAAFLDSLAQSWGTSRATLGLTSLVHYLAAPLLASLAVAAADALPSLPTWSQDRAWCGLANVSGLLALVYLLFTWGAVRG